jgi:hypothetical protein
MPRRTNAQIAADAERDRIAAEAAAQAVKVEGTPENNAIKRQTEMAWWCPLCDNSQTTLQPECGNCGAVRDGDHVKAKG